MKILIKALLGMLMIGLTACGTHAPKKLKALQPGTYTQTLAAQQQWQFTRGDEHYVLQIYIEQSPQQWRWVLMSNLGQRLVTVTGGAGKVIIDQQQNHPALKYLQQLIEAYQLSFWSPQELGNWQVRDSIQHRDLLFSGILRAAVYYQTSANQNANAPWSSHLIYDNKKQHFQLTIDSQLLNL